MDWLRMIDGYFFDEDDTAGHRVAFYGFFAYCAVILFITLLFW